MTASTLGGRPISARGRRLRAAVPGLLVDGPRSARDLGAALGVSPRIVTRVLRILRSERRVQMIGASTSATWALPGWVAPPPPAPVVVAPQPAPRRADGPALRQPHERPTTITVPVDAPSWWVGTPREDFSRAAAAALPHMRESKFANTVHLNPWGRD